MSGPSPARRTADALAGNLAAGLALVVALALLPGAAQAAPAVPAGPEQAEAFRVVAHRGFVSPSTTENTLPAIRQAAKRGATGVELDLRHTRDGRIVLLHDPTLERTMTCRGTVAKRSWRAVRRACGARDGAGGVPTLEQALDVVRGKRLGAVLELKGKGWSDDDLARIERATVERGLVGRAVLLSPYLGLHRRAAALAPSLGRHLLADSWGQASRARGVVTGVNIKPNDLTLARITKLYAAGLLVSARVTNTRSGWRLMARLGIKSAVTDRAGAYARWLARRG